MSKEEQNMELPNEAVKPVEQPVPEQPVEVPTEQPVQAAEPVQEAPTAQSFSAGQVYVTSSQPADQSSVNTEAAKTKATELVESAKKGLGNYTEKLKTDKKVLGITVAVVVILVLLFGGLYLNGGSKGVVKSFAKAYVKSDTKKIVKLMHEDYLEASEDSHFDIEETFDEMFDKYDDEDYKVLSYELVDSDKLDKKKVEDIAEDLEDNCDIDEDTVKAAVVYTVKFKVDDDGDKDTLKVEVTAVKIKGKWYLFLGDIS